MGQKLSKVRKSFGWRILNGECWRGRSCEARKCQKSKNLPKTDKERPISNRTAQNRTPNFFHTEGTEGDNFPADSETTTDGENRRVYPQRTQRTQKRNFDGRNGLRTGDGTPNTAPRSFGPSKSWARHTFRPFSIFLDGGGVSGHKRATTMLAHRVASGLLTIDTFPVFLIALFCGSENGNFHHFGFGHSELLL